MKVDEITHDFEIYVRIKAVSEVIAYGPGIVPLILEATDHGRYFNFIPRLLFLSQGRPRDEKFMKPASHLMIRAEIAYGNGWG